MKCPVCDCLLSKVVDSRYAAESNSIRRRRECLACGRRFTTYETAEAAPIMVVKKNGAIQPFDKQKIIHGVIKSCEKRPVSLIDIENIASDILRELKDSGVSQVSSDNVGELVMQKLKALDRVAFVRFASVYREFEDASNFLDYLKNE